MGRQPFCLDTNLCTHQQTNEKKHAKHLPIKLYLQFLFTHVVEDILSHKSKKTGNIDKSILSWSHTKIAAAKFKMTQTISSTLIDIINFDLLFGNLARSTTSSGYAKCHQNNKSTLQPPPDCLQESVAPVHVVSRGTMWAKGVHNVMLISINLFCMNEISSVNEAGMRY